MNISDINGCNKVPSKEKLLNQLILYKKILNSKSLNYLESLIELELSILKNYLQDEKEKLSELEIYRNIAIYNIYYRALEIFKKDESIIALGNEDGFAGLNVYKNNYPIFNFEYGSDVYHGIYIPSYYKSEKIGSIRLYQTINLSKSKEKNALNLFNKLNYLYGINSSSKESILTIDDKKKIDATNYYCDLFYKDYGLNDDLFMEETNDEAQKTLILKKPNIVIRKTVNYL